MKTKSSQNFKKIENKDLKKIKGGQKYWTYADGRWVVIEI